MRINNFFKITTKKLLPFRNEEELRCVITKCHNFILDEMGHDPAKAFDELTKLLILKIYDEQQSINYYKFRIYPNEKIKDAANRIRELFKEIRESPEYKDIFTESDVKIDLSDYAIYNIIHELQDFTLVGTTENLHGADIKGTAFEQMVGSTFRGELGQYFTPRELVEFIVEFLDPDLNDVILDPACGSGGFLIMCIKYIKEKMKNSNLSKIEIEKLIKEFSNKGLIGIDINSRMVRIAKINMIMHGVSHSGIFKCNGILVNSIPQELKERLKNKVDLVFSNPPFAGYFRDPKILRQFKLASFKGKTRPVSKEILFIEKIIDLLKVGGKTGLVLPLGIFSNPSLNYVREYIMKHTKILAVIGLPTWAFQHTQTGVKGALIFLEKAEKIPEDYEIFFAWAEHIGYDSTGRKEEKNDLPRIINNYRKKIEEIPEDPDFLQLNTNNLTFFTRFIKFSKVKNEGRLDPEYFHPKYEEIEKLIKNSKEKLVSLCEVLKFVKSSKNVFRKNPEREFLYLETNDIDFEKRKIISSHKFLGKKAPSRATYIIKTGDFIIPNAKDSIKGVIRVPKEYDGYVATSRFIVARLKNKLIDPDYLLYILNTRIILNLLRRQGTGEITLSIREKDLCKIKIPLPPLNEQRKIVSEYEKRIKMINDQIEKLEKEKDLLQKKFEERLLSV